MVSTKFKEIRDICIQTTINAAWGTCSITMQGEAFATFTLCPFKTAISNLCLTNTHNICVHAQKVVMWNAYTLICKPFP